MIKSHFMLEKRYTVNNNIKKYTILDLIINSEKVKGCLE